MLKSRDLSDRRFQLDALDGLRGLAVLLVVVSHMSNHGLMLAPFANFSGTGKSGVFLFFVLSSFLLTYPFIVKGRAALDKSFLLNYAYRRFLRIYPLYFVYLTLGLTSTVLLARFLGSTRAVGVPFTLSVQEYLAHLFLQQGKGVTWSIVVEFHYYFLLPFVAILFAVLLGRKVVPAFLATVGLITAVQLVWPQSETPVNDIRLGPYLPIFFVGSFAAVVHYHLNQSGVTVSKRLRRSIEAAGWCAIPMLIALAPSVSNALLGDRLPHEVIHRQYILFAVLWATVVLACTDGTGALRKVFESPPLRYLGFISFSIYLLHVMVPGVVTRVVPFPALQSWGILLATIAVAHVSWLLIERPTSRWPIPARLLAMMRSPTEPAPK